MTQSSTLYAGRAILIILLWIPITAFPQNPVYHFDENLKITDYGLTSYSVANNVPVSADELGDWKTNFSVPGIIGNIYSSASDEQSLYLGGNFKLAGSIKANGIVRWDGSKWHSIGDGDENGISSDSTGMPVVLAITTYHNLVFVGGQFSRAGTTEVNGIAFWDGEKWNRLGSSANNGVRSIALIENDTLVQPGSIYSLFVHNDKLYVGGYFHMAGNSKANGVAIWDLKKQEWEPMRGGLSSINENPSAYGYGFAELNGQIYVGGKFDQAGNKPAGNIAVWDGNNWSGIGDLPTNIIDIKSDQKGNIYAVGYYQENDTSGNSGLGIWDGNCWKKVPGPEGYQSTISKIKFINEKLFVTGIFERSDGLKASLARWNGKDWKVIHGPGYAYNSLLPAVIRGIEYIKGRYYIAGDFTRVNDQYVVNVAEWDESNDTWKLLDDGTGNKGIYDGSVFVVENQGNNILAGGSFSVAGGKFARSIAQWNGNEWKSLGNGDENGIFGMVFTILTRDQNVFAGGYFGRAGSTEAFHIAQWDGKRWQPIGIGVGGIHGAHVRDLALMGDYLYVAGYFSKVGDQYNFDIPANSIARFNLVTRRWDAPVNGLEYDEGMPGMAYDIEVYANQILIGGNFKRAGGGHALNFTILEGLEFKNPGSSADVEGLVNAVEVVNDQILIGGHLLQGRNYHDVSGILKWNGDGWDQVSDENLETDHGMLFVTDIESFREGFIAGGYFNKAGDKDLNNIAYFNGSEWLDVGGGIQRGVSDIIIVDNSLFLSGPDMISSMGSNGIGLAEFDFNEVTATDEIADDNTPLSNYPNPFRNSTVLNYHVKYPAKVDFAVYDISGKRIKTLLNEYMREGQYTATLHSADLDPGIYLCRISYGNETETLKLIVSE